LRAPFQIEMLSVYLVRAFALDLVEHMARLRAPDTAVPLDPAIRRMFGIGNSTGLGMAPFLLNHPALINNWIRARETALARVRGLPTASAAQIESLHKFVQRAMSNARQWQSDHPVQQRKCAELRADLDRLGAHLRANPPTGPEPWNQLWLWAEQNLGLEGQEQLVSLLIEPHGDLVDDLADDMNADEEAFFTIDGAMPLSRLRALAHDIHDWAAVTDWDQPGAQARVWYTSVTKQEPRLGERAAEPIEPYEQPLCAGRDAARMMRDLENEPDGPIAGFLLRHPEHRHIVRRVQIAARCPYGEIRDNTIAAEMLPIDLLRAKLSFFGAVHFDPRSDRWVRINMFRNAPFPDELARDDGDDWTYPPLTGPAR